MTTQSLDSVLTAEREVTVIVADDHPVVCIGVRNILSAATGIRVVGQAENGEEAIQLVKTLKPDVLLLDVSMPKVSGLQVLEELARSHSTTRVILLTAVMCKEQLLVAMESGARGLILKDSAADDVVQAIKCVIDGQYWFDRKAVSSLVHLLRMLADEAKQPAPATKFGLTERESQMIGAIVEGGTNKDIAQQFAISEDTVKRHLTHIFDKVGVSNRLELALFAIHHKLAPKS